MSNCKSEVLIFPFKTNLYNSDENHVRCSHTIILAVMYTSIFLCVGGWGVE